MIDFGKQLDGCMTQNVSSGEHFATLEWDSQGGDWGSLLVSERVDLVELACGEFIYYLVGQTQMGEVLKLQPLLFNN